MQQLTVPACYFPSKILFLGEACSALNGPSCRLFSSYDSLLNFLCQHQHDVDALQRTCKSHALHVQDHVLHPNLLTLAPLYAEVHNPSRFDELSVLVADAQQHGDAAWAICAQPHARALKKLVLIEAHDEPRALEAMARGLIHAYVTKTIHEEWGHSIKNRVEQLKHAYFIDMSLMVQRALAVVFPPWMHHPEAIGFLDVLCQQNNIVEYYLMAASGIFLMVNANADASILIIHDHHQVADIELDPASFLPCVIGNQCYDYALMPVVEVLKFQRAHVLSYADYMNEAATELMV